MENLQILSRSEMKDITAGSEDCQWSSCRTTSTYYNCLLTMCDVWYSGYADNLRCTTTVNNAHISMMGECGLEYQ